MKRLFVCLLLIVFFGAARGSEKPNIILMMADALGHGDVGFNGNKPARSTLK